MACFVILVALLLVANTAVAQVNVEKCSFE